MPASQSQGPMRCLCGTYVVASEVVDGSLGEHGVVLELRLAERGSVASDDDQLGLARAQALEGRLVAKGDCRMLVRLWVGIIDAIAPATTTAGERLPLPDFMTRASLELMELASFLLFLTGAILSVCDV